MKVILPLNWQSRICQDFLGGFNVGAFESNNEREMKSEGFAGVDDPVSDGGTVDNASKYVHKNGFYSDKENKKPLLNKIIVFSL